MDFVQERYIKDKYIGDMEEIKDMGDGRICGAISSLSSNLTVYYDKDTDYIVVKSGDKSKNVIKVGFKSWGIFKDGILDPSLSFSKSGGNANCYVTDMKYIFIGPSDYQLRTIWNYYSIPIDVTSWDKITFSAYYVGDYSGQTPPIVGLSLTQNVAPTVGNVTVTATAMTRYEINTSSLEGVYYFTVGTRSFADSIDYYINKHMYCGEIIAS